MDVIDLNAEREKRDGPDADCTKTDQWGRRMYLYALEYSFADARWATDIWAYSVEDAEERVAAMRESLVVLGQTYAVIPAF